MPEYLENPRRVPREPVRCLARLTLASGAVETATEDIGSRGCQVVLPFACRRGDAVALSISTPRHPETLRVDGRIAWVSPQAPFRVGIAYAALGLPGAAAWMERLRAAAPDLFPNGRRAPQRVPVDAMVFLGKVPALADFNEDELVVLRKVGAGVRVGDLRTLPSLGWPRAQRAFFSLLGRGYVILSRAEATHPVLWKRILGDPAGAKAPEKPRDRAVDVAVADDFVIERTLEEALPEGAIPVPTPAPERASGPDPVPPPLPKGAPAKLEAPFASGAAASTPPPLPGTAEAAQRSGRHAPDFSGAGVGWRTPARPRSAEAEALLKAARAEMDEHRTLKALTLLRKALSLAPGDPEIASAIGTAMQESNGAP